MISIVVLSYNHEKYILETLNSILSLDNVEKEIIIIDDGSKDNSYDVITNFLEEVKSYTSIKFIQKENSGLVHSLNLGLEIATGEYIYFIASDDLVCSGDFISMYKLLSQDKKIAAALGNAWVYFPDTELSAKTYNVEHDYFFSLSDKEIRKSIFINYPKPLLLQATIFRREVLVNLGGWDPDLAWDDYPMFVKLISAYSVKHKEIIYCRDLTVAKYRQHELNTYKNFEKQFLMVENALRSLSPAHLLPLALANQCAFYFLLSLYNKNFCLVKLITKTVIRKKIFIKFTFSLQKELYKWLRRKCK